MLLISCTASTASTSTTSKLVILVSTMCARVEAHVTSKASGGSGSGEVSYYSSYYSSASKIKSHHVVIVLVIVGLILLFHLRHKIAAAHDRYRTRNRLRYSRLNAGTNGFDDDLEAGLSSGNFDIESNIANNDTRKGLSENAKSQIKSIMESTNVSFDEARLKYLQQQLGKHDIDVNGMPLDPKTVTFS